MPWRARYKRPDGTWGSEPKFATKSAALKWGNDQEAAMRAGRWQDPRSGEITLSRWWEKWKPLQDYAPRTWEKYESYFKNHLDPWRGGAAIRDIDMLDTEAFERELRRRLAGSTVDGIMTVLRLLMDDAVEAGRLLATPIKAKRSHRRGRRAPVENPPRRGIAITLEQFLTIAGRLPADVAMMATVAIFTGMRWGEAIGMRRSFLMLVPADGDQAAQGWYIIDDKIGAWHQPDKAKSGFGPPKNGKGRTLELPAFLVELLLVYVEAMPAGRDLLFVNRVGEPHRRGQAAAVAWRRACDGWPEYEGRRGHAPYPAAPAVAEALRFHDLRHSHKTWLVEDGIPAPVRDERLGHGRRARNDTGAVEGAMDEVYVHATEVMRGRLLDALQARWEAAAGKTAVLELMISHSFPS